MALVDGDPRRKTVFLEGKTRVGPNLLRQVVAGMFRISSERVNLADPRLSVGRETGGRGRRGITVTYAGGDDLPVV